MNFLTVYIDSVFQDFESFLRTEVDLVEDNIKLFLYEHNSKFITCEITPCFYTFKDLSEVVSRKTQVGFDEIFNSIDIEFNDISMKTKMSLGPDINA